MSYRFGMLMSQNLGHRVHDKILREYVSRDASVHATWMPIKPWARDVWQKVPLVRSNMTLLSGLRARDQLRRKEHSFDLLYCHTQEAATLLKPHMRQVPTVLSMDATPRNMDMFGRWYGHYNRSPLMERWKHALTCRVFRRATHLVAFSNWVRNSLVNDYGIPDDRITVIPPGIDLSLWSLPGDRSPPDSAGRKTRVLFVGGDFVRKGGDLLLQAAAAMQEQWQVDIVTGEDIPQAAGSPNVRIHHSLQPGSAELRALYLQADAFALPTHADCSSWAIIEAMAMRLPVVTTNVGGLQELVDGDSGIFVRPGSVAELIDAVNLLAENPERTRAMGDCARLRVEKLFDARMNSARLIELLKSVADRRKRERRLKS